MKDFETEYQRWMNWHLSRRKGERLRMLKEQDSTGRKLFLKEAWWIVVGKFDFLHPEYEVVCMNRIHYFMDLAYVRFPKPTDLEFDGFSTHARDADRKSFSNSRQRQNAIVLKDWHILRFSIDDLRESPKYCRTVLEEMLQQWYCEEKKIWSKLPLNKREIMRLATRATQPMSVSETAAVLDYSTKQTRMLLHQLVEEGWLKPTSGNTRVTSYQIAQN